MAFDSVNNSTSFAKDFSKKKKASRSAKLKQCKLDARRQQWLSQVKNKESKDEVNVVGGEIRVCPNHGSNERDRVIKLLEVNPGNDENDGLVNHYSDSDSSSRSPSNHSSSVVGNNCSGTSFTGSGSSSRSSNSSSSGRSHSGNISEEDDNDDDDGCFPDWEAVADALAANDSKQQQEQLKPSQESPLEHERTKLDCPVESGNSQALVVDISNKPKSGISRAWRPDDAFRPQNLPNLFKQHSFPTRLDRHGGFGSVAWACTNGISVPSSCPICCEDLDVTDTSFLPCSCGFRLCLFCHKRILEEDGRCPGCRKQYQHDGVRGEENGNFGEGSSSFRLIRSYSVITRS